MECREWYFIDIDGCIMDSVFNNEFYKNDKEKLEVIAKVYQRIVKEDIQLYPEFIQWFQKIAKQINTLHIHFITGRQEDVFGFLTRYQLQSLSKYYPFFKITFYPNYSTHDWQEYKDFKNDSIAEILEKKVEPEDIIKIYDDKEFLDDDMKRALREYEFHLITKAEDWCEL